MNRKIACTDGTADEVMDAETASVLAMPAVISIIQTAGFYQCEVSSMELMTEIALEYMTCFAGHAREAAAANCRLQMTLDDIGAAMSVLPISLMALRKEMHKKKTKKTN